MSLFFVSACAFLYSNAQIKMPAPSTTQTIKQDFALGNIELIYSRPNAKGRKIYGDLVPYNKLWRTGANTATKIMFTDAVELGGKKIDTGTYVLYSIPGVDSWEIILNKGLGNWGIDGYKEGQDVLRFKVVPQKIRTYYETFTMQFVNIKPESCDLQILWEKTAVNIPVTSNVKDRLKAQIDKTIIKAPFNGLLGLRNISPGAYVTTIIRYNVNGIAPFNEVSVLFRNSKINFYFIYLL